MVSSWLKGDVTKEEVMLRVTKKYDVIAEIDLDHYHTLAEPAADLWLDTTVAELAKKSFKKMDRIVFYHNKKDVYLPKTQAGQLLTKLVKAVVDNKIPFHAVQVLTNNPDIERELVVLCGKQERIADLAHNEGSFERIVIKPEPAPVPVPKPQPRPEPISEPPPVVAPTPAPVVEVKPEPMPEPIPAPVPVVETPQPAPPRPQPVLVQPQQMAADAEILIPGFEVLENEEMWSQRVIDEAPPIPEPVPEPEPAVVAEQPKPNVYAYGSAEPVKVALASLQQDHQQLLSESRTFCIYPWIHLHAWPTGQAFPCCHSEHTGELGNTQRQSLDEIWNSKPMRDLRVNMLSGERTDACKRCYEQEASGFFSGRQSANKHHGHHIARVDATAADGTLDEFKMTYWDIRFSNLCNLSCRSCGHIFSSSWYKDQAELAGPEWKAANKPLNVAGRWETDIWEQLIPHLDYVEQIYFAGGEPLLMEEHYKILDELERRGRFDVRLIYNTNFTETSLKGRSVFDYWRKFDSVAVGASLDAMGPRAEYIRKGTRWQLVEFNRQRMMNDCPNVDFYISPTLSILNADHLPDFHKAWVEKGLIRAQDLNVNILQDPPHYRIDIADPYYKAQLTRKFEQHLEWLRPQDNLRRATVGFESAIKFLNADDKSNLLPEFWSRTGQLDAIRDERILDVLPELTALKR